MGNLKLRHTFVALLITLFWFTLAQSQVRTLTLQSAQSTGNGSVFTIGGTSYLLAEIIGSAGADRVVNWEGTQNGTNYVALMCTNVTTLAKATTTTANSTTPILMSCPVAGLQLFRARLSGGATGTVTVTATALPNVSGGSGGGLCISEADGSPSGCPWMLKFTSGTVTDNGDGTFTVTVTGGAGTPGGVVDNLQKNDGASGFAAYGGTACTNQFPRSLDANGAATCATVASGDLAASLALTTPNIGAATGTSLSVSGQLISTVATGTAPLVVASTTAVANLKASNVTTNANLTGGVTSSGNVATLQRSCQPGLGDGLNAVAAGTYPMMGCLNSFGSTWTIMAIKCYSDNNGTTTLDVKNGAGTSLLTAVITCTNSFASGTQSATTTIASADYIKITVVADGTSKNVFASITGTW